MKALQNKKGFTLVEVIVVLVILAILIALLAPSLTGYIDKAQQKGALAEARNVQMAAQTLASEAYATAATPAAITVDWTNTDPGKSVQALSESPGSLDGGATTIATPNGKVGAFTYVSSKGTKVKYDPAAAEPFTVVE